MKESVLLFCFALCVSFASKAQDINWRSLNEPYKHLAAISFGADYTSNYGIAYGYKLPTNFPIVLGTEVSIPFGDKPFDDWKLKLNAQTELWHNDNFSFGIKPGIIVRRYQSEVSRFYNIGADIITTFGYCRSKWGIVAEVNYDRALSTNIRHDILKEYYPEIQDGWYGSTGGNFKFGLKGNYSFKSWNVFVKTGKPYSQDFKNNPTLPFYFDLSLSKYL
jgi:hypothetical protein